MKVLVVDDDVVSRMVLMHLIDSCGKFEILEAEDGEDAWRQLENGLRPAITFCDLRMPRLSGMALLERVKADGAFGAMPFVLVSSANDRGTVEQAADMGAAGYIVKPFEPDQVRSHMAAFGPPAPPAPAAAALQAAESPLATTRRLGISNERLLVYLGGFQSQLAEGSGEIAILLARGDRDASRMRIERLQVGCQTLGLNGAAAALRALAAAPLDAEQVSEVLADAVGAVVAQADAAKRLQN
jgi:two-component system, chemotaxis family, chemotaxis protein CheY